MATYQRPGTYVEEVLLPQQIASAGTATSVGCFLGAASRGPVEPSFVSSWTEFTQRYGTFSATQPLHFAVFQFFSNGGRQAYIQRVVGTGSAKANVTLTDRDTTPNATLKVSAVNAGKWANASTAKTGLSVEAVDGMTASTFDLIVYRGGATSGYAVERFSELSMDPDDGRYVARVVNAQSALVTVEVLSNDTAAPNNMPAAGGVTPLASGADGSAPVQDDYINALDLLDPIGESLVLNIPDSVYLSSASHTAITNAAITYAEGRADVFVVVDATDEVVDDMLDFATGLTGTSYAAVYGPFLNIPDPVGSTGAVRKVAPGGAVVGQYLATDAMYGVAKAPAGIQTSLSGVLSTARRFTNDELASMNSAAHPINAIRPVPGVGFAIMGARTLKPTQSDKYVNVRRSLIFLRKQMKDLTAFAVFQNNDQRLWAQIKTTLGVFLNDFWQRGGLRGGTATAAYFVRCDSTLNTPAVIAAGEVRVEIGVALQSPAEFIVISLGQFQGGATVTEQ